MKNRLLYTRAVLFIPGAMNREWMLSKAGKS